MASPPEETKRSRHAAADGKVVVEEVTGWLRVYDDGSVDRTWLGPPEAEFLTRPHHPLPEDALALDGISLHDVTVSRPPAGDLHIRVYLPAGAGGGGKLPVLLHFQGGGFCVSRATWYMYYQFYSRLSVFAGAVVVSVNTRLAPEHRLPAAVDDCYSALLWLRSLARREPGAVDPAGLGGLADFSHVFLVGESSGGNLVHEVAARAGTEEEEEGGGFWSPLSLAGAIQIHPAFVRSKRSRSEVEAEETPFLTLEMVDKMLALALPEGATKDHPTTCPMGEAAPAMEALRLPPIMVAVAEGDLMRDTEEEYCEALEKAGKDVEVFFSAGVAHAFHLNKIAADLDPEVGRATAGLIDAIKGFMARH